jgi:predicted RNase H-like HicB family nuclease
MAFTAVLEQDKETGWWVAQCAELPGALTQGRNKAEAKRNLKYAIRELLLAQRQLTVSHAAGRVRLERVA